MAAAAQGNVAAGASIGDSLNQDSSFLNRVDPVIAAPFKQGFVDSTHLVFILAGCVAAAAFVLVLIMREVPLRMMSAIQEQQAEQAAAADGTAGSAPQEQDLLVQAAESAGTVPAPAATPNRHQAGATGDGTGDGTVLDGGRHSLERADGAGANRRVDELARSVDGAADGAGSERGPGRHAAEG
jgi:hypothetical protein